MLEKVADITENPWTAHCPHPEHEPPAHIVLEPGVYRHTCPGCGRSVEFTVRGTFW